MNHAFHAFRADFFAGDHRYGPREAVASVLTYLGTGSATISWDLMGDGLKYGI